MPLDCQSITSPTYESFEKLSLATLSRTMKDAAIQWSQDRCATMGAALSYYTTFSIAPMLLIVVAVAGLVFGEEAARGEILGQLKSLLGDSAGQAVVSILAGASNPAHGWISAIVGTIVLVIGATTVFAELKDSLDHIFKSFPNKESGVWVLLRTRVLPFGMILGMGFLMLVSLVFGAGINALQRWWAPVFGDMANLLEVVNFASGMALTVTMFAMIYKWIPNFKLTWRDVWLGTIITAILFQIGRTLIGLYIGRSGVATSFGAAGSLVVLLVWVYFSAQIFLYGAELTKLYAERFGSRREG